MYGIWTETSSMDVVNHGGHFIKPISSGPILARPKIEKNDETFSTFSRFDLIENVYKLPSFEVTAKHFLFE